MSKSRKPPFKNKPLPRVPNRKLPPKPVQRSNSSPKPRPFTLNQSATYQTTASTPNGNTSFTTYTTTYYTTTTSSHPWSAASSTKPKKLQNKTNNKVPTTTIVYSNTPEASDMNTNNPYYNITSNETRNERAMTLPDSQPPNVPNIKSHRSYHKVLPLAPNIQNIDMQYSLNDFVELTDNRVGSIRFIGEISVELNGAIWYGIELSSNKGDNNGTLKGVQYFKCKDNFGTFVERKTIRWLSSGIGSDPDTPHDIISDLDLESASRFHINQLVRIKNKKGKAQIRFVGLFCDEYKYGVELLDDMGVHSGCINAKFYFTCSIFRGMFVNQSDLIHLDYYDEEKDSMHNRSSHRLFSNLPTFNDNKFKYRNGNESDDSDASIESDAESVSSVNTLSTIDDAVFDRIQLNEEETDMAFTQILNKYKNVERTQPRPSALKMNIDTKKVLDGLGILHQIHRQQSKDSGCDQSSVGSIEPNSALSLDLSETSPIQQDPKYGHEDFSDVGCKLDDDDDGDDGDDGLGTPFTPTPTDNNLVSLYQKVDGALVDDIKLPSKTSKTQKTEKKMSIVVQMMPKIRNIHSENSEPIDNIQEDEESPHSMDAITNESNGGLPRLSEDEYTQQYENDDNNNDNDDGDNNNECDASEIPSTIETENKLTENEEIEEENNNNLPETEVVEQKSNTLVPKKANGRALSSLSPLGLSPMDPIHSHSIDNLSDEWLFDAENSHLKEIPDSPYDVNTTQREFANTAQVIQLGCNNPYKLFKILKAMTMKLFLNEMKYRILSAKSKKIRAKLLNYEGVEEFLNQLGFKLTDNGNKLQCPLDQPPLSVLDAATNVCSDYIGKCFRKRAVIDTIKRFNPSNLHEVVKGTEFDRIRQKKLKNYKSQKNIKPKYVQKQEQEQEEEEEKSQKPLKKQKKKVQQEKEEEVVNNINNTIPGAQPGDDIIGNDDNEQQKEGGQDMNVMNVVISKEGIDDELDGIQVPVLKPVLSKEEEEELAVEVALDEVYEPRNSIKNTLDARDTTDLELEDEDLEGIGDTFELFDIMSSITHEDNTDNSARQIILLCYITFTEGLEIFTCLDRRFFDSTHSSKQWVIQTKVISFIQIWMRQYWDEDWCTNVILLNCIETFFKKVGEIYGSTDKYDKYKKLVDMLLKTMSFQRINKRNQSISQSNPHEWGMTPINKQKSITEKRFDSTYDFFKLNNTKIARQITNMDQTYFGAIKARECLGQSWKKQNKYEIAKNICQFIDHFNRIAKWVQTRVLLCKDAKKRGRIIKKFIKICDQLFILRNFQSLYAVYGALYSSAIIRLKKAWHYVPTKHLAKFEEFKVIFATKRNMANLRKLHRETYPPMIPYTGIFLQDLLSIEEGNRKRKHDGSVNFARLLRLSTVIDSILLHQKTLYKINPDKQLQALIKMELKLNQNISEEYLWKLSDKVMKIDSKKSNFIQMFGAK